MGLYPSPKANISTCFPKISSPRTYSGFFFIFKYFAEFDCLGYINFSSGWADAFPAKIMLEHTFWRRPPCLNRFFSVLKAICSGNPPLRSVPKNIFKSFVPSFLELVNIVVFVWTTSEIIHFLFFGKSRGKDEFCVKRNFHFWSWSHWLGKCA